MLHHYIKDDTSGEHWGVSSDTSKGIVLTQIQEGSTQARIQITPTQAREFACELIRNADLIDELNDV